MMGIMIPFFGTSLGASLVFVLRDSISENLQKILTGFAAGVMVAASFWSLLQPALESSEGMGSFAFVPAAVGFLIGVGFLASAGYRNAAYAHGPAGRRPQIGP